ncbi:MAG: gamma-glutamyl-gamma-aminobutyrate hydrolase family protein [Gemmatimonadota bacterium]|nr:gamma-glutamyl-gamma-aminobutyrate hydrolase family protein [Gemmatimonadota bacterium]
MPMPFPLVAVTATSETVRDIPRVRVNRAYTDALIRAGLTPLVVPPLAAEQAEALLARVDGLVLTGGDDVDARLYGQSPHPKAEPPDPARDRSEIALVHAARRAALPTLAICRGVQVLNVALGGTLVQDIASQRPDALAHARSDARSQRVHDVSLVPGTRLARLCGAERIAVNSLHHQSLDRIAGGLRLAARADDGIVEAVEWGDDAWWLIGVQWHPEELDRSGEPWDGALFAAFAAVVSSATATASRPAPGA